MGRVSDWPLHARCHTAHHPLLPLQVADAFEAKVVEHAKAYATVDGLAAADLALDGPAIGPMVSETQRQIVHKQVVAATSAGAKVLLGGALPPKSQKGTFYPPTVLGSVPHDAKAITQEETFGPVVALSTFDGTDATAVRLANDSTYGLTASVYSGDLARAGRVAAQISAGQVGINTNPLSGARSILSPFCGHKRSGYGSHSGRDGWRQFSTPKTLIYTAKPAVTDLPVQAQPSLPSAKVERSWARGVAIDLVRWTVVGGALACATLAIQKARAK